MSPRRDTNAGRELERKEGMDVYARIQEDQDRNLLSLQRQEKYEAACVVKRSFPRLKQSYSMNAARSIT